MGQTVVLLRLTLVDLCRDSSTLLTGFGLGKTGNNRERRIGVPFAPDRSKVTKKARLRTKDDASLSRSAPESNKDSTVKVGINEAIVLYCDAMQHVMLMGFLCCSVSSDR